MGKFQDFPHQHFIVYFAYVVEHLVYYFSSKHLAQMSCHSNNNNTGEERTKCCSHKKIEMILCSCPKQCQCVGQCKCGKCTEDKSKCTCPTASCVCDGDCACDHCQPPDASDDDLTTPRSCCC